MSKLGIVTEPTNARKYVKVSCIINTVFLLHVSAILVAILRKVHYKGYFTKVFEPVLLSFKNMWFKIYIKI